MKKASKWMTMAAVLTLSATMAVAAPHAGGKGGKFGGKRGGAFSERLADKLNLSDAQREQIRNLKQSFRAQNQPFFESSRETRKAFREAKKANDTARVEQLEPTVNAQRAQFQQLRAAHEQQVLAVLTAEQRAQYESLKAQRQQRRGRRS